MQDALVWEWRSEGVERVLGREHRVVHLEAVEEEEAPSMCLELNLLGYLDNLADEAGAWWSRISIDEVPFSVIDRDKAFHRELCP